MIHNIDRLAKEVGQDISSDIDRLGLFYRIFTRGKTVGSIEKKIKEKRYTETGKLLQDAIGVRITLYFDDDLAILYKYLKSRPNYKDESVDHDQETVFKPTRINLIFNLEGAKLEELTDTVISRYESVDATYEVQLRTVFSEGWHEIDHDFRYKCKSEWDDYKEMSRTFNGLFASLITHDWSMLSLFNQLAYRNYKNNRWGAMLRNKYRMRFLDEPLSSKLVELFDRDRNLPKRLFKVNREEFLFKALNEGIHVPISLSNIVYLVNIFYIENEEILLVTPDILKESLRRI